MNRVTEGVYDPHGKLAAALKEDFVDIYKLPAGSIVLVRTKNNEYVIEPLGVKDKEGKVIVEGGKYFPQPIECWFSGSTFGGSMLWSGRIGQMMYMEFYKEKTITTTGVRAIKVLAPDFVFQPDWSEW